MQEDPASQNLSTHERILTSHSHNSAQEGITKMFRSKDQKTKRPQRHVYLCTPADSSGKMPLTPFQLSCINRLTRILCRSSTEPSQQLCSVVPYLIEFTRVNSHSDSSKSNRCDMRHCEIKQLRSSHCHQELQFIMTRIFRVTRVKCSASLEKPQLMRNVRMQQHRNTLCPHGRQCKSTSQNCT